MLIQLFLNRSIYRANFSTVAAIDASVSVDLVLVSAFCNSVYRAF